VKGRDNSGGGGGKVGQDLSFHSVSRLDRYRKAVRVRFVVCTKERVPVGQKRKTDRGSDTRSPIVDKPTVHQVSFISSRGSPRTVFCLAMHRTWCH